MSKPCEAASPGATAAPFASGLGATENAGEEANDMLWIETTKSSDAGALSGSGWSAFGPGGKSPYFLPADFPLEPGPPGVDESELLLSGQCDVLITAITPRALLDGDPGIKRLFPNVE